MIKSTCLLTVLGCVAAPVVFAAGNTTDGETRFRNLDQNQNDHVSLYEARDRHRVFYYYQRADKNEDGHIDMTEFSAFEAEVPDFETK
jgi:hypothetical protein